MRMEKLYQANTTLDGATTTKLCRYHHYLAFKWMNTLEGAGDGAWASIDGESVEFIVAGSVIDPDVAMDIVSAKSGNEFVALYTSGGVTKAVIQLDNSIHRSLINSCETVRMLHMDAALTQERLAGIE